MRTTTKKTGVMRGLGPRGFVGRGRGGAMYVQAADEWRATTVQACGLWPFAAGTGTPRVGVPLGQNLLTGATFCCDPLSWFLNPGGQQYIHNPSAIIFGIPGLGKSTVIRRMALGLTGFGTLPLILGDLKPDYVDLIQALGGQVISVGHGTGHINVLDQGEVAAVAKQLPAPERKQLESAALRRRHHMVAGLMGIIRHAPLSDREDTILARAVRVLDDRFDTSGGRVPVLRDLLDVIQSAPEDVRLVAVDRGSMSRYRELTEGLEASLHGLMGGGRLGTIFSEPTTTPMLRDRPVAFDISRLGDHDEELQAAVLMACWSEGFAVVESAHALANAGVEPRRHYFVVMDELWRALRSTGGMVERIDRLTRLNRTQGVATAMVTHTMEDFNALPTQADRDKAKGFVERAAMVICGGLPARELANLGQVVKLSDAEQKMITSWVDPGGWDEDASGDSPPPGRGNFLVKVGGRPGIPFHLRLTDAELELNDTNKQWRASAERAPLEAIG